MTHDMCINMSGLRYTRGNTFVTDKGVVIKDEFITYLPGCYCAYIMDDDSMFMVVRGDNGKRDYINYKSNKFNEDSIELVEAKGLLNIVNIFVYESIVVMSNSKGVRYMFNSNGEKLSNNYHTEEEYRHMRKIPESSIGISNGEFVSSDILNDENAGFHDNCMWSKNFLICGNHLRKFNSNLDDAYREERYGSDDPKDDAYAVLCDGELYFSMESEGINEKLDGKWMSAPVSLLGVLYAVHANGRLHDLRYAGDFWKVYYREIVGNDEVDSVSFDDVSRMGISRYEADGYLPPNEYTETVNPVGYLHGLYVTKGRKVNIKSALSVVDR